MFAAAPTLEPAPLRCYRRQSQVVAFSQSLAPPVSAARGVQRLKPLLSPMPCHLCRWNSSHRRASASAGHPSYLRSSRCEDRSSGTAVARSHPNALRRCHRGLPSCSSSSWNFFTSLLGVSGRLLPKLSLPILAI